MNDITILAISNEDRILFRDKLREFGIKSRVLNSLCGECSSGLPIYLTLYLKGKNKGKWNFEYPDKISNKLNIIELEEFKQLTKE